MTETPYTVVNRWHDENHPGVFRHCTEQPCHAIHVLTGQGRAEAGRRG